MDGTEWKIGCFELHVLVLAAQVNGIAIPVYFKVYEHKGVLSERERINFIRKALIIIDLEGKLLVAYAPTWEEGAQWFEFEGPHDLDMVDVVLEALWAEEDEDQEYIS